MRRCFIRIMVVAALLLCFSGAGAAGGLVIVKQLNGISNDAAGAVEYTVADGTCSLVVTPATGNYIAPRFVKAEKMVSGDQALSRAAAPVIAGTIVVTAVDEDADSTAVNTFTFAMPSAEYDVRLTVNFQPTPDVGEVYPLWVGRIQVNDNISANVLGQEQPTVIFNSKDRVLALDHAALKDMTIRTTLDSLNIYLKGENTITANGQTAPFVNTADKGVLVFTTDGNNPGSLVATTATGQLTTGFNRVDYRYHLTAEATGVQTYAVKVLLEPLPIDLDEFEGGIVHTQFEADDYVEAGDDKDLSNTVIDNVLYTLKDNDKEDGDGFDDGTTQDDGPGIVLNTVVVDEQVNALLQYQPGTQDYADHFAGLTISVPAGTGFIHIVAATTADYALGVKVGRQEPAIFRGLASGDKVTVSYAVLEPTYVYIYNAGTTAPQTPVRSWRGGKKTATCVKIYAVDTEPQVLIGINSSSAVLGGSGEPVKMVSASQNYSAGGATTGGLQIGEVMGMAVTDLGENLLDGIDLKTVNYVDLSKSKVAGLVASRTSGPLAGVGPQTLIFLPQGCDAGDEANVVVNGVCSRMTLSAGSTFFTPYDFMAEQFSFDRSFTVGQPAGYYLPIDLTAEQAAALGIFHSFVEVKGLQTLFDGGLTGGVQANRAYVFEPKTIKIQLGNVAVRALPSSAEARLQRAPQSAGLYGTYEPLIVADGQTDLYRIDADAQGTRFTRLGTGGTIAPFSVYLSAATAADQLEVVLGVTDGIATAHTASATDGPWFTLGGQRLGGQPVRKGCYILNGRKMVVK